MSFIDNPVVASLAAATGLNQVLGTASTQAAAPPKSPQMQSEFREARPPVNPRSVGPQSIPGGRAPITGVPGTEPGLMDAATLRAPSTQTLLAHFGVTAPSNIDDHLFIHDPDAFAKHPLIANMIEQGLGGLANYHTGQDTAGTLSNIAQSVIGNQSMHAQAYNNRAMMPLMQAQQIAALQDQVGKQALQAAQQKHDNAMATYYEQLNATRQNIATTNANARTDVADTNAGARTNTSPVAQINQRVLARVNTIPGNSYSSMQEVPGDVWNKAYNDQQVAENQATHTAQTAIANGHDATSRANANTRAGKGGANGKLDAGSAATDKDLVSSIKDASSRYQYLDSLSKMSPAQRTLTALDPKNSKYGVSDTSDDGLEAQKQALAQKAGSLHTQRAKLYASRGMNYTGVQPDAPAAAPASGNPFRQ